MRISPNKIQRDIVLNVKAPQNQRIAALKFLSNPSYALLRQIAESPSSPGRLAAIAASMYVLKAAQAEQAKIARETTALQSAQEEQHGQVQF